MSDFLGVSITRLAIHQAVSYLKRKQWRREPGGRILRLNRAAGTVLVRLSGVKRFLFYVNPAS